MRHKALAVSLFVLLGPTAVLWGQSAGKTSGPEKPDAISAAAWREDLDYLIRRLEIMHPNLYANVTREAFSGYADDLRNRIPGRTANDMIIGIHELLAHVRNLHTFCTPVLSLPGLTEIRKDYRYYPVRFYPFEDGLYVKAIAKKHEIACGKKVVKIGNLTAEEAMERLARFVAADNEMTLLEYIPRYFLHDGPMLKYIGASDSSDRVRLLLSDEDGREFDHPLETEDRMPGLISMNDGSPNPVPLYLRRPNHLYWFEYLPPQKAIYLQINAFVQRRDEPFDAFCRRLFETFDEKNAERLIIDIRQNTGGNHIELPLLKSILNRPGLDRPDHLFVIIGRTTVSAAQHFTSELVRYTNATFFGEPTCSKPNQYGAIRRFVLPNSRLQIGCAVDYYQDAQPYDFSTMTEPHFFVRLSSADYRENRDPVLEHIFNYDTYKDLRPEFASKMADAYKTSGLEGLKKAYAQVKPDYLKYGFNMKMLLYDDLAGTVERSKTNDLDYIGYLRFVQSEWPKAIDVCYDLGSSLERSGNTEEAKTYYRRCLQLNPEHSYARMKLGLLDLEEKTGQKTERRLTAEKPKAALML